MTAPRITRRMLREWGACWSDGKIAAVVPPEGVTVWDALDAPESLLDVDDRVWVVVRALPEHDARLFGCRCAARALRTAGVTDIRAWRAIWTAAQYAYGLATDEQLAAARAAARDAITAIHTTGHAVSRIYGATVDAYIAAASATAASATADNAAAAWRAARISATWAEDDDAERCRQLADLRRICLRVWGQP